MIQSFTILFLQELQKNRRSSILDSTLLCTPLGRGKVPVKRLLVIDGKPFFLSSTQCRLQIFYRYNSEWLADPDCIIQRAEIFMNAKLVEVGMFFSAYVTSCFNFFKFHCVQLLIPTYWLYVYHWPLQILQWSAVQIPLVLPGRKRIFLLCRSDT